MVEVMVSEGRVGLTLRGLDRLLALRRTVSFSLRNLRAVYTDPQPQYVRPPQQGVRAPGSGVPGVVRAGTFRWDGYREFWCDYYRGNAVVFELEGEAYDRVVVAVRNPEAVVREVRTARRRHPTWS